MEVRKDLNTKDKNILLRIIQEGSITSQSLQKDFALTKGQVEYRIAKINEELVLKKLPKIRRSKQKYYVDKETASYFLNDDKKDIYFSPEERRNIIITLILGRDSPVSLIDLIINLKVSKNTVLTDINSLRKELQTVNLNIKNTRKLGYFIAGNEWTKRIRLQQAVNQICTTFKFKSDAVTSFINFENLSQVQQDVSEIEQALNKRYTDENFISLTFYLSLILKRIKRGKTIKNAQIGKDKDIEQTDEYQFLINNKTVFSNIPKYELHFIALCILSSNVSDQISSTDSYVSPELKNTLWQFIYSFEQNSFIVLPNKDELIQKLFNHFRPAYFRIKYGFPTYNPLYKEIIEKYSSLHEIVRQSVTPINQFFGHEIANEEIAYITLFVGGHLVENNLNTTNNKIMTAITICPNGISASKILQATLEKTFPEFSFYPACTVREYKNFILPHDIVFSTVPVESSKKVFVIKNLMDADNIQSLRNAVFKELFNLNYRDINYEQIINVVQKYSKVSDAQGLKRGIKQLLATPKSKLNSGATAVKPAIVYLEGKQSWQTIMQLVSQPLLEQEIITATFLPKLEAEYQSQPEYILIGNKIALLHLNPSDIKQKLGLSILVSKYPIKYANRNIHLIALLTTPNKTKHLNLLFKVKQLSEDKELIKRLSYSNSQEEVKQILETFFEKVDE
ncbi:BglG family transcription antiterminator [Lactobacillus sp. ESL0700]|uniref:BglG family transcription antiterminator n=1 Tax=Lactobacillus sp. ESL0700 TaxID=2983216 RepID=UPI0023F63076|nr:BglG family transcription antiterminator [Lactobacillus sp. ESL0700]WEV51567.1 BglG family transcription antiterminator [Lactobacillus sp. ESL0700]